MIRRVAQIAAVGFCLLLGPGKIEGVQDLTELGLEELMEIRVTTVSRKEEVQRNAAAAVYVITGDDIRRSGVRSIPEALRMAPGVQVARVDANKWVVTVRGFSGLFANKLLVLLDGRSVYTPLFSGVFWEAQDVLLEDVERIEVIRGPGGTLWGANAVNGIINIITRKAADTQGGFVQAGAGSEERVFGAMRYGAKAGEGTAFRVYGKYELRDASKGVGVPDRNDDWYVYRAGGRLDRTFSPEHELTVQGDLYGGEVGQFIYTVAALTPLELPAEQAVHSKAHIGGGNVQANWQRKFGGSSVVAVQASFDRAHRDEAVLRGAIHTLSLDFQHRSQVGRRLEVAWGTGYRRVWDWFEGGAVTDFEPNRRTTHLLSGFVHQELALVRERLVLTLGSKFEHHTYAGFELQPNVRLRWHPTPSYTFWGAASRAVRTPSRAERDLRGVYQVLPPDSLFSGSPPVVLEIRGAPDMQSEVVKAFELGGRMSLGGRFTADLTGFYARYNRLRTNELDIQNAQVNIQPLYLRVPVRIDNRAHGWTSGFEVALDWQPRPGWMLRGGYGFFRMGLHVDENSTDVTTETFDEENPEHQVQLRSFLDLGEAVELDVTTRYVGHLPAQKLSGYFTADVRLAWRLTPKVQVCLVGQNLLDSPRTEFVSSGSRTLPAQIQRGGYGSIQWMF
ncbi:MAG: TonB-dependent receptor [bacterium]|nr:TonB-dependent receptor [bacterium]